MKKKIYVVGTLLMVAMSAMFVSCDKDTSANGNTPANGCKCTIEEDGYKDTHAFTTLEMINELGVESCGALTNLLKELNAEEVEEGAKFSCKGY